VVIIQVSGLEKQAHAIANLKTNVWELSDTLHLSADAAVLLSQAAGVDLTKAQADLNQQLGSYVSLNYQALTANPLLTSTILNVDAAVMSAKDGFNAYGAALAVVNGITNNAYSSHIDFKQSLSDMTAQLAKNTKTFNDNTNAGRANVRIVQSGVNAMDKDADAAYKTAYAHSKLADETDRRNAAAAAGNHVLQRDADAIIRGGEASGYSHDQMVRLLEQMGILNSHGVVIKYDTKDYPQVTSQLGDLEKQIHYLTDKTWFIDLATRGGVSTPAGGVLLPQSDIGGTLLNPSPHALGGPTIAGTTYLVGEKGPELWTAGTNGYVTPNDRLPAWDGGQASLGQARGGDGADLAGLLAENNRLLMQQNQHLARIAASTAHVPGVGADVADALNGVANRSSFKARTTVSRP
jgi:hypothetical protein